MFSSIFCCCCWHIKVLRSFRAVMLVGHEFLPLTTVTFPFPIKLWGNRKKMSYFQQIVEELKNLCYVIEQMEITLEHQSSFSL